MPCAKATPSMRDEQPPEPKGANQEQKPIKSSSFAQSWVYWAMVMELTMSIAGSMVIGFLLDRWLQTSPLCFLIFLLAGCTGAFFILLRIAKRLERSSKQ